jgi:ligand-binding sensor domain-containing protein
MKKIFILLIFIGNALLANDWTSFHTGNSVLPSNFVKAVCIEPSGVKWFGTDAGLVRYDGSEWRVFAQTEEKQTLADNRVTDIAFERTGYGPEIWVGTENGLTILNTDGFTFATPYRTDDRPLLSNHIHAVAVDSNHVKWFATDQGISIFDSSDWWSLTEENGLLRQNDVLSIGIDNECDSLWRYFGTSEESVSRIYYRDLDAVSYASPYKDDKNWTPMMSDSVTAFQVINTQRCWIGTGLGVYRHDSTETKENWHSYTTYEGLVHDFVLSLAEGRDGSMWIGTMGGISRFVDEEFINYTVSDGLAGNRVNDIAVDIDGSLWFATDGGVSHLVNPSGVRHQGILPRKSLLISNYPNPFNPSTVIQYQLEQPGMVRIAVFSIYGREVVRLYRGIRSPGLHQVTWSGTDGSGLPVAAGAYIVRLFIEGTQHKDCMKILFIK